MMKKAALRGAFLAEEASGNPADCGVLDGTSAEKTDQSITDPVPLAFRPLITQGLADEYVYENKLTALLPLSTFTLDRGNGANGDFLAALTPPVGCGFRRF